MVVKVKDTLDIRHLPRGLQQAWHYLVLERGPEWVRVCNASGDPVVYELELFDVVDPSDTPGWAWRRYHDGTSCADLPGLEQYDWEGYHDGVPEAQRRVRTAIKALGSTSWPAQTR